MASQVKYKPDRYHSVIPYLVVQDVDGLIDFIKQVFNGEVVERMQKPDGSTIHAEVRLGDSILMIGEAGNGNVPFPGMIHLYLADADATYQRALAAGAVSLREPADQFYGDRSGGVKDRFGNQWWISTHVEDVSPDEMQRRFRSQVSE
ncbi:MAG: VOC family protein [Omnitrophica WOR_2 bacterium]